MFAKVFEQIFDSTVAQDYTVRHMFIDLLILADPTGAVDMTYDAIARRTNVPLATVERCISELCQPDVKSRSQLHEGKRIIPLDSHRDWGWQIVNYGHYRKIRDQEVRRSYFRDYQRKRRKKIRSVKDKMVNKGEHVELSSSSSSSKNSKKGDSKGKPKDESEVVAHCVQIGLPETDGHYYFDKWEGNGYRNGQHKIKDWRKVISSHKTAGYCPSQKNSGKQFGKPQRPSRQTEAELWYDKTYGKTQRDG